MQRGIAAKNHGLQLFGLLHRRQVNKSLGSEIMTNVDLGNLKMKNYKSPIKAVFLNIALPGLGLVYLNKWGLAFLFFILSPLRLIAGIAIIGLIPFSILGNFGTLVHIALIYAWWLVIMYEICKTPYDLADEYNRKKTSRVNPASE